jgi:hypothetical protein
VDVYTANYKHLQILKHFMNMNVHDDGAGLVHLPYVFMWLENIGTMDEVQITDPSNECSYGTLCVKVLK